MGDFLDSFSTTQKAKNTCIEVIKTVSSREFELDKFFSNSPIILKEISKISKVFSKDLHLQNTPLQRALGVL